MRTRLLAKLRSSFSDLNNLLIVLSITIITGSVGTAMVVDYVVVPKLQKQLREMGQTQLPPLVFDHYDYGENEVEATNETDIVSTVLVKADPIQ